MSEEAKVKEEAAGDRITIKVQDQNGSTVQFKVKLTTPFQKIFDAFCKQKSVDPATMRFHLDGQRIQGKHTPAELEMEDNDSIDAFVAQVGGWALRVATAA